MVFWSWSFRLAFRTTQKCFFSGVGFFQHTPFTCMSEEKNENVTFLTNFLIFLECIFFSKILKICLHFKIFWKFFQISKNFEFFFQNFEIHFLQVNGGFTVNFSKSDILIKGRIAKTRYSFSCSKIFVFFHFFSPVKWNWIHVFDRIY